MSIGVDPAPVRLYVGVMFAVDHVLVSDALLDAPFCCSLSACAGACCVEGARGAPLDPDERAELELALPVVQHRLSDAAKRTIAAEGVWEGDEKRGYATTTVGGRECVFVADRKGTAVCAIQEAHMEGKLDWEKPLSCHLYPVRVESYGTGDERVEVINYERIGLCTPAEPHGRRLGIQLADFLTRPLTRRYGDDWVERFKRSLAERRETLGIGPAAPLPEPVPVRPPPAQSPPDPER